MKMLSAHLRAAIAAAMMLVIALSGRGWAEDVGVLVASTTKANWAHIIRKPNTEPNPAPYFLPGLDTKHNSSGSRISHVNWRNIRETEIAEVLVENKYRIIRNETSTTEKTFTQVNQQESFNSMKNIHSTRKSETCNTENEEKRHDALQHDCTGSTCTTNSLDENVVEKTRGFVSNRRKKHACRHRSIIVPENKVRGVTSTLQANEVYGSGTFFSDQLLSEHIRSQMDRASESDNALTPLRILRQYSSVNRRIVGGRSTKIEDFPYIASLERRGKHSCSLCILTNSWLLTAAHCVINIATEDLSGDPKDFSVLAGTTAITEDVTRACVKDQVRRDVERIMLHPRFNVLTLQRDMALVRVTWPLYFNEKIQPAVLPKADLSSGRNLRTGRICNVAGWGSTGKRASRAVVLSGNEAICTLGRENYSLPVLQTVTVPLLSIPECIDRYEWAESSLNARDHICTLAKAEDDACTGDSGGPLICDGVVVAVVSWGIKCTNSSNPNVYARIDTHLHWIKNATAVQAADRASRQLEITLNVLATTITIVCCM